LHWARVSVYFGGGRRLRSPPKRFKDEYAHAGAEGLDAADPPPGKTIEGKVPE
jgi:hypothetical protein